MGPCGLAGGRGAGAASLFHRKKFSAVAGRCVPEELSDTVAPSHSSERAARPRTLTLTPSAIGDATIPDEPRGSPRSFPRQPQLVVPPNDGDGTVRDGGAAGADSLSLVIAPTTIINVAVTTGTVRGRALAVATTARPLDALPAVPGAARRFGGRRAQPPDAPRRRLGDDPPGRRAQEEDVPHEVEAQADGGQGP